jgi:hypothetical protein
MMARRPSTFKQSDIARAVKGVKAAGEEVAKVEIDKEGNIIVSVGKPDMTAGRKEIVL